MRAMECCSAKKRNNALIDASCANLDNMMLSGKRHTQKATYCMIPFIWRVQNRQTLTGWSCIWLPGAGSRGSGEWLLMDAGFLLDWWMCSRIRRWKWSHNFEYTKNYWTVYFKRIHDMNCISKKKDKVASVCTQWRKGRPLTHSHVLTGSVTGPSLRYCIWKRQP